MEHNDISKEEEFRKLIEESIKSTNKSIYHWGKRDKANQKLLNYQDVRGLVINWLKRCLQIKYDYTKISRLFNSGYVNVWVDPHTGYLQGIEILDYKSCSSPIATIEGINKVFKSIDYKSLTYTYEAINEAYGAIVVSSISFDSIKQITF